MLRIMNRACWAGMVVLLVTRMAVALDAPAKKSPAEAPASEGIITIKLAPAALSSPGWVMTPGDGAHPHLRTGIVSPRQWVTAFPGKPGSVSIGGVPATVLFDGKSCSIKNEFSQVVLRPTRATDGFGPADLKTAKDKAYPVAFPVSMIYAGKSVTLGVRPGFGMRGQAGGLSALLFDDNMDGRFTLAKDALRIGDSTSGVGVFAPAAKFIATPAGLYEVRELAEDGTSITLAKADAKAARLQIAFASDALEIHAAFASSESSFVAVANARSSPNFTVSPGKYELRYGLAYSPGLGKVVGAVMPARLESINVSADRPAKVVMGAPFRLDFPARLQGGKISIHTVLLKVKGKANETYADFKWVAPPEVRITSAQGQTATLGKMSFS